VEVKQNSEDPKSAISSSAFYLCFLETLGSLIISSYSSFFDLISWSLSSLASSPGVISSSGSGALGAGAMDSKGSSYLTS